MNERLNPAGNPQEEQVIAEMIERLSKVETPVAIAFPSTGYCFLFADWTSGEIPPKQRLRVYRRRRPLRTTDQGLFDYRRSWIDLFQERPFAKAIRSLTEERGVTPKHWERAMATLRKEEGRHHIPQVANLAGFNGGSFRDSKALEKTELYHFYPYPEDYF